MITDYEAFRESAQPAEFGQLFGKRVEQALTYREKHRGGFVVAPVEIGGYLEKELAPGKTHTKLIVTMSNGRVKHDAVVAEVLDLNGTSRTQVQINGAVVYDRAGQNHDLDDLLGVLGRCYSKHLERIRVRVLPN